MWRRNSCTQLHIFTFIHNVHDEKGLKCGAFDKICGEFCKYQIKKGLKIDILEK